MSHNNTLLVQPTVTCSHDDYICLVFFPALPQCPNLSVCERVCVCVRECVCAFTLQLSGDIYKPLSTPSLAFSASPKRLLWHFNALFVNCAALSLLSRPHLSSLLLSPPLSSSSPTTIINTSFHQASPLVLLHLHLSSSSPSLPLFPSLASLSSPQGRVHPSYFLRHPPGYPVFSLHSLTLSSFTLSALPPSSSPLYLILPSLLPSLIFPPQSTVQITAVSTSFLNKENPPGVSGA